jgi:hypothetical protein
MTSDEISKGNYKSIYDLKKEEFDELLLNLNFCKGVK